MDFGINPDDHFDLLAIAYPVICSQYLAEPDSREAYARQFFKIGESKNTLYLILIR